MRISTEQFQSLKNRGIYVVSGDIELSLTRDIYNWILSHRPRRTQLTIAINSSGGSPMASHEFGANLNTLAKSFRLRGVAFGECGSAAMYLLQCCTFRYAVSGCAFFVHNISTTVKADCENFDIKHAKRNVAQTKRMHDEMISFQCSRTGMSEKAWRKLADGGSGKTFRPIYCAEALKKGLVDRVVSRYPLF